MSDMPAQLARLKILHQLRHATQCLLGAEREKNTYSMAYANAGLDTTPRRRNHLRDKLESACIEVAYHEHEVHCLAVDAGLAQPEPERYGVPRRAFTPAGDRIAGGEARYPTTWPASPISAIEKTLATPSPTTTPATPAPSF